MEFDISHLVETMTYVGKMPWHGLAGWPAYQRLAARDGTGLVDPNDITDS
ncbi:hypothetical protein [Chromobacterium violaceum]|nr:hypothetical protein [Chromobacterium violaceum]